MHCFIMKKNALKLKSILQAFAYKTSPKFSPSSVVFSSFWVLCGDNPVLDKSNTGRLY